MQIKTVLLSFFNFFVQGCGGREEVVVCFLCTTCSSEMVGVGGREGGGGAGSTSPHNTKSV